MAFPTFRAGSGLAGNSGASASVGVSVPTGLAAGDLWVACIRIAIPTTSTISTMPSGFSEPTNGRAAIAAGTSMVIALVKIAGASETSATFTFSASGTSAWNSFAITGVNQVAPIHIAAARGTNTASATWAAPAVTTTVANCLLLGLFGADGNGTTSTNTLTNIISSGSASRGTAGSGQGQQSPDPGTTSPEKSLTSTSLAYGAVTLAASPPVPPAVPTGLTATLHTA